MKTSDFDYDLPEELIAQHPAAARDGSRLLVYDRKTQTIQDKYFYEIGEFINAGDCVVLNNTRVIPARLLGKKIAVPGQRSCDMEFLLIRQLDDKHWETMVRPGRRATTGSRFDFGGELTATVVGNAPGGNRIVELEFAGDFSSILSRVGNIPLPPYITAKQDDEARYQTVYAKQNGSVAAPTAGLHFTPELIESLREKRVHVEEILLHVGIGTFRPVKSENIDDHKMHSEYFEVSPETADRINGARADGGRIICVGTTVCRTLETMAAINGKIESGRGATDIFIKPGYVFKTADCLITNFHIPKSTLLMLVSAFMGSEEALRVYRYAVESRYRFFSFGDAMLIR